ncbi:HIRAN domain-containing protein [Gracilibacillus alcaliphilus]|uniref:HIRAN domain-containing protein n=1 Tax=Gracilibacillus alcaliphilus TaxID=1401441 RepID=UPI00195CA2A6|nr:HIRAN domain-containing protein [Gracilibacillus alcaliphilus]MBM7676134.1 hypothetical protein [Gracilibacillus alcaliphilus]
MGIFDFLFKNKSDKSEKEKHQTNITTEIKEEYKGPVSIAETSYSVTKREKYGIFEYIDFKIAGTSFYQKAIKKAIQQEKDSIFFDEKFEGMTNKEILEDTYDEPIFEYAGALFSNCSLQLEPDNEYDSKAIAVYIDSYMVGHVPKKGFLEGKEYIYNLLNGALKDNQELNFSISLRGGKYKINRDGKIDTGESDYKLDGQVTIKTEHN